MLLAAPACEVRWAASSPSPDPSSLPIRTADARVARVGSFQVIVPTLMIENRAAKERQRTDRDYWRSCMPIPTGGRSESCPMVIALHKGPASSLRESILDDVASSNRLTGRHALC